jgi:hypothetical protein
LPRDQASTHSRQFVPESLDRLDVELANLGRECDNRKKQSYRDEANNPHDEGLSDLENQNKDCFGGTPKPAPETGALPEQMREP